MALVLAAVLLACTAGPLLAAPDPAARALAERYSPIVFLKAQTGPCDTSGEAFGPSPVNPLLGNPAIVLARGGNAVRRAPTGADINGLDEDYSLDFPGNPLRPGCEYEQAAREWGMGVPPRNPTTYVHMATQADRPGLLAMQYWFFYYFNDFVNVHEGDWELVQVLFRARTPAEALRTEPIGVAYSQHSNGERAEWGDPRIRTEGDHLLVFTARGSHASFYGPGLWLARGPSEGLGCDETRGPHVRVPVRPVLLPAVAPGPAAPFAWMGFDGRWGEPLPSPFGGITGPWATPRWTEPITWHESIRSSSTLIPEGGPQVVTNGFCATVEGGSRLLLVVGGNPLAGITLLLLVAIGVVFVARRTSWARVPFLPIVQARRAGEVVRSGFAFIRGAPPGMWAVGLVFVPVAIVAAGVQWLLLRIPFVNTVIERAMNPDAITVLGAWLLAAPTGIIGFSAAIALVAEGLHLQEQEGSPPPWRRILRETGRRGWAITRTVAGSALIVIVLIETVIGIPWAFLRLVDVQLLVPITTLEGRQGPDARRRSRALTRGDRLPVAVVALAAGLIPVVVAPLLAMPLLLIPGLSLVVVNLVGAGIAAVVTPFAAGVVVMLYGARVAAVDGAAGRLPG